tara:strand:+ start:1845 stop:2111 length:267 start_codon:yes stop_codon:yes gene_type:complete
MIIKNLIILFTVFFFTSFINYKVILIENKIFEFNKYKIKAEESLELIEINWAYLTKPSNLKKLNAETYGLEPILFEDVLNMKIYGRKK